MKSRRAFIKNGGLAMFGIGLGGIPLFVTKAAAGYKQSRLYKNPKILVCIFQRGAMDGLMAVTPFMDRYLQNARPDLFISAAKNTSQPSLIDLDGKFGMHPSMKSFDILFKEGRLGIVHGIGSPNNTRSHFDAQDFMESGTPFIKNTKTGWLNRAVGILGHERSPLQAVSLTASTPRSFYGDNATISVKNLDEFKILGSGNLDPAATADSFEALYEKTSESILKDAGKESFEAMKMLQKVNTRNYRPENNAVYPKSPLGGALRQIAQLIKMRVGLEIAFAESGGWDTHINQGKDSGVFARNIKDLSTSITAFWNDLGALQDDVTIMTMTEFGRTVKQNGTGGTDHGRASCNFIIGNDVAGGKVHGNIQPLAIENLEDCRDLAVTTDFRSVFSEVADKHLRLKNDKALFPGWDGKYAGVMRPA